jgi:hypothetical protein
MAKKNKLMWLYIFPFVVPALMLVADYFGLISDDVWQTLGEIFKDRMGRP